MANRQRAEARRKAQAKASRSNGEDGGGSGSGSGSKMGIWIGLVAVVALVVGIIVFVGGGDDSDTNASENTSDSSGIASLPTSQPVTVTGTPLAPFDSSASPDPAFGLDAPGLSGLNFSGEPMVVEPGTGGPYMLVYLAHWCPHCNAEVPKLIDWKNSGAVPAELQVIGIATAVSKDSANYPPAVWFSNKGWPWPVLVDEAAGEGEAGKAAVAYGASGWPYFVIVGADGKVKARVSGAIEISDLQPIVDAALAA